MASPKMKETSSIVGPCGTILSDLLASHILPTNSLKMDGWKMIFLGGDGPFSSFLLLVLGSPPGYFFFSKNRFCKINSPECGINLIPPDCRGWVLSRLRLMAQLTNMKLLEEGNGFCERKVWTWKSITTRWMKTGKLKNTSLSSSWPSVGSGILLFFCIDCPEIKWISVRTRIINWNTKRTNSTGLRI